MEISEDFKDLSEVVGKKVTLSGIPVANNMGAALDTDHGRVFIDGLELWRISVPDEVSVTGVVHYEEAIKGGFDEDGMPMQSFPAYYKLVDWEFND